MFYIFNNIKKKYIFDSFVNALDTEYKNEFLSNITNFALELGISGNIWQKYLLYVLIFNDNPYTRQIERRHVDNVLELARLDLKEYYRLYNIKRDFMESIINFNFPVKKTEVAIALDELESKIDLNYESFEKEILGFYENTGLAFMSLYKAFRVLDGNLSPIYNILNVGFDDLIGYDYQKELLINNTLDFINDRPANNVLLYGDSGTGKSTSIKALINTYFKDGLRIIEVYKHQMEEISKIVNTLRNRPYHYIIYMDDLSFEEDEIEYKYLKSVIEGGIEPKPSNVLIYATSNRRHLIKETTEDNMGSDLHRNETEAEKLSLAYRFGLQIFYSNLSPMEFRDMVIKLAKKNNLKLDEKTLLSEANMWQLTYGSLSGRCATQFINYISNKYIK